MTTKQISSSSQRIKKKKRPAQLEDMSPIRQFGVPDDENDAALGNITHGLQPDSFLSPTGKQSEHCYSKPTPKYGVASNGSPVRNV